VTTLVPLCLGWMSNAADMFVPGEPGTIRYPVPGYAVVHERGTVLFDTGLHESLLSSDAMLGALAPMFTVELTPADLPESRLAEAGIDPASVTHVVNSHLHFDHCGHNGPFADAVTLVQAPEWDAAQRPTKYAYVGVPLDEIGGGDLRLVEGEVDLFGDGTVVLVPTPGHTVGHQSLLVRAGPESGADSALLVGDACYLRRMLTADITPSFAIDRPGQLDSYRTLERYEAAGARLIFSHDVDEWDAVPAGLRPTTVG
jgi:glyoxylase-like metal-dependent hydrolase (beta-lactamase superfamily II)